MNRDPAALAKIPVGEGHSVSAVGVYGAYKKGDGSARTYLLVPQAIENIVVHAHDAFEEAVLRAATAAASDPRLLGGDIIKTFVFRRFLWAFLALVIS